jgi:protein subunit release factor B
MFYVITESCVQVDSSPFDSRADAQNWVVENGQPGIRYWVLTETEMDEMEASGCGGQG